MVKSAASSVDEYLEGLPEDRRAVIEEVRKLIRKNLPKGYEESVTSGMLSYEIPLARYPKTYNKQPLPYLALGAQKNYYALYMMGAYSDPAQTKALQDGFQKAGKKLDMGKSCVRFKKLDDLDVSTLAKVIASTPPEKFIELYEASRPAKK